MRLKWEQTEVDKAHSMMAVIVFTVCEKKKNQMVLFTHDLIVSVLDSFQVKCNDAQDRKLLYIRTYLIITGTDRLQFMYLFIY